MDRSARKIHQQYVKSLHNKKLVKSLIKKKSFAKDLRCVYRDSERKLHCLLEEEKKRKREKKEEDSQMSQVSQIPP